MGILDRRRLLAGAGAAVSAPFLARWSPAWGAADPFTLGVASGDPAPDGFVLWTRLAPEPLAADGLGGMAKPAPVGWEIAADEGMRTIVAKGQAVARAELGYTVHVEATGLRPGRPYWYRFTAMGAQSPIGRAMTAPAPGARLERLKLNFASCSHWEVGYFSAYRHMAAEQPDLVLFLGDYIYEDSYSPTSKVVRRHDQPGEITTLADYRRRYALHRTDPDLQALHRAAACMVTWDDHEVQNDYANDRSEHRETRPKDFLVRRAAAYRAFYENMPLRRDALPKGPDMRLYRRLRFGDLAEFAVLDGRQYRSPEACPPATGLIGGHMIPPPCPERLDPRRTMLGGAQEQWLYQGFRNQSTRWNIMAQDLLVGAMAQPTPSGATAHWSDAWDGYPATRDRVLAAIEESRLSNPVFFGGDIHSFWTTELRRRPDGPIVASEFVGTSVTSDGPPHGQISALLPFNPHVKFFDARNHGYVSVDLNAERMQARYQIVSDRTDPKATVSTLKSFVVESGKPGPVEA
jgi:alkaline phosphatase D